jgi:hypothetical protein
MLTLCTLLPSDNKRLVGLFKGFADLLLSASDNIPILSGGKYRAHIEIYPPIEKSTHSDFDKYNIIYYLCILYFTILYHAIVYQYIICKSINIQF